MSPEELKEFVDQEAHILRTTGLKGSARSTYELFASAKAAWFDNPTQQNQLLWRRAALVYGVNCLIDDRSDDALIAFDTNPTGRLDTRPRPEDEQNRAMHVMMLVNGLTTQLCYVEDGNELLLKVDEAAESINLFPYVPPVYHRWWAIPEMYGAVIANDLCEDRERAARHAREAMTHIAPSRQPQLLVLAKYFMGEGDGTYFYHGWRKLRRHARFTLDECLYFFNNLE